MKPANLLVLLCCTISLHACATTPRVVATPNVCPAKREQPLNLMRDIPERLPALAETLPKNWGPAQAADSLQKLRRESGALYAACVDSRAGLIDWIRSQP